MHLLPYVNKRRPSDCQLANEDKLITIREMVEPILMNFGLLILHKTKYGINSQVYVSDLGNQVEMTIHQ